MNYIDTLREQSEEYKKFLEKFEVKHPTDEVYTDSEVYDAVLDYARETFDIKGKKVVRPFYPGGDYENFDYTDSVVIDNPPFSIIGKIVTHYTQRDIPFLLFAPHLTGIHYLRNKDVTLVATEGRIMYEKGVTVRTNFITNVMKDVAIKTAPRLTENLEEIYKKKARKTNKVFKKYEYPDNLLISTSLNPIARAGLDFEVKRDEVKRIRCLDNIERGKKYEIFGSGVLISSRKWAEFKELKKIADSKSRKEEEREGINLSARELEIIRKLDEKDRY